MHEIVCRSTEGLLRTGIWTAGAAGRPGSARFATEGCTCSANTRGKAGQKRGLALGHITTEQPATDPADSPVCIGLADFGFVFSPKEKLGKTSGNSRSQYFNFDDLFSRVTLKLFGSSRYRRATLAIELGGRSNLPKWSFPISWRFVPPLFCYAKRFSFSPCGAWVLR